MDSTSDDHEERQTLYQRLLAVDARELELEAFHSDVRDLASKSKGYLEVTVGEIDYDPVAEKRAIIEEYRSDPFVAAVLAGETTFEETSIQINKPFRGYRRWLPKMKPDGHDELLAELEGIVHTYPYKVGSKIKEILSPYQPLGITMYIIAGTAIALILATIGAPSADQFLDPKFISIYGNIALLI